MTIKHRPPRPDPAELPLAEVVERLVNRTANTCRFWGSAQGWAPIEAADLLSRSRLDRQVALTECLADYVDRDEGELNDGHLILAWANLGSLVEGALKLFLSVFYEDYRADVDGIRYGRGGKKKRKPGHAMLAELIRFFDKRIWVEDETWAAWLNEVKDFRNAIHAYRDREIGDWAGFHLALRTYLLFLRRLDENMPYPPDGDGPPEAWELGRLEAQPGATPWG